MQEKYRKLWEVILWQAVFSFIVLFHKRLPSIDLTNTTKLSSIFWHGATKITSKTEKETKRETYIYIRIYINTKYTPVPSSAKCSLGLNSYWTIRLESGRFKPDFNVWNCTGYPVTQKSVVSPFWTFLPWYLHQLVNQNKFRTHKACLIVGK